jgi:DNA topoisomerase I
MLKSVRDSSTSMPTPEILTDPDPVQSAKAAGLRYVSDTRPGIQRKRFGKGFRYLDPNGAPLRDKDALARIRSLAIPPAWTDVWICPLSNGHLQATGRDAKKRKQSRYHPRWREVRDETKYSRMKLFGELLPAIREHVERDLSLAGLPREKILATIVRLLETTFIRIGNTEYARNNQSFGLTTLRNRHVDVNGSKVRFHFKGKSGKQHSIDLNDRRVARIIQRCLDLPGYELFQYIDEEGAHHTVDSADVNDYLREISSENFTAKDFRTWAGSVLACTMLREFETFASETEAKRNILRAIESVAARLGNTPSVCRKCYVHPAVLECYRAGIMTQAFLEQVELEAEKHIEKQTHPLQPEEFRLMHLLTLPALPKAS